MRLEHELTPIVTKWLKDTKHSPYTAQQSVSKVMKDLSQTPQRRRRRWSLPWRRSSRTTSPEVAHRDLHPAPIQATNGHAPTVIGRTQTMFSPVKAITAGALVFAIGGMFLIAQPFDRLGGGVPGAEQGADPVAPVEVTATFRDIGCEGYDSSDVVGRVVTIYGNTCTVDNEWSDPRLQGTETYVDNYVDYADHGLTIGHYVHNIVTDDGAWRMRPQFRIESAGTGNFSGTWVLDGEGAYEGLSVVLAKDELDSVPLTGYIISTDLVPPAPEGASTQ